MFYRRKILLGLLEVFDNSLEIDRFYKLLFLLSQTQDKPSFDFVPYFNGGFSFSADADMMTMISKNMLAQNDANYIKLDNINYFSQLTNSDQSNLLKIKQNFGKINDIDLAKYIYLNHPYWTIKSDAAKNILTKQEYSKVEDAKPNLSKTILYTIGYEGISLEKYFNKLIQNDIKILADVRYNPVSMKFGFSKKTLSACCKVLDIDYKHFPELGIHGEDRQELHTQSDYDKLFSLYKINNLSKTQQSQIKILALLNNHQPIALTCFEANINQCHRKHLAEAISGLVSFRYEVRHI
ncbi:MAG: DUF488 domain-containing protein [Ignavibacteria bacterium]|jgi:hypothetical protein|nr:DUF488 domain-containing protein [Ignavibacteria bacterium]